MASMAIVAITDSLASLASMAIMGSEANGARIKSMALVSNMVTS